MKTPKPEQPECDCVYAIGGRKCCGAEEPKEGWLCCRPAHHRGDHRACTKDHHSLFVWRNIKAPSVILKRAKKLHKLALRTYCKAANVTIGERWTWEDLGPEKQAAWIAVAKFSLKSR